jgi:orotate phosphoribosyltransferase
MFKPNEARIPEANLRIIGKPEMTREVLLSRLRDLAMVSGREMRLASGRTSDIYFDMKMAMFEPETINLIADTILDELRRRGSKQIGGLEMGAVPIIAAVVCKSFPQQPVRGFFVRKSVKAHGTQKKIEGHFDPNAPTLLLDDVTTTGGSVLEAVKAVREQGGDATAVLTVVDRKEGAREALAQAGVELIALYAKSDFRS